MDTRSRLGFAALLAPLVLLVGACESPSDDPEDPPDVPPFEDPTDAVFDPDNLIRIDIEMTNDDWDFVREQTRSVDILSGEDCLDQPFGSPFTYVEATVIIDGEVVENVGVRKKGFLGSLDTNKPSLKIKFDKYVDQRYSGMKRMTLNNNRQDSAYIRQCIGYQLFAKAGVPAPRCNFARVTVNGDYLGIYAHVENVKKRFLARHYDDNDGQLFEGTLSDYRVGWDATFDPKTNKSAPDRTDVDAIVAALEAPDSQLLDELEPLLDVDKFLTFWAMEILINHVDGYANNTNNFFVYSDPTSGLVEFLPWGIDNILNPGNDFPDGDNPPLSVFATGMLSRRLYLLPETRDRYVERLQELLDTVWDENELLDEIDRMEELIEPFIDDDLFITGRDLGDEIDEIRDFVRDRRGDLEPELADPPGWEFDLRGSFCFIEIGTVNLTFDTTFGTLSLPDPFSNGTGTLGGDLEGSALNPTQLGTKSGLDPENPGNAQIQMLAQTAPDIVLVFVFNVSVGDFNSGVTLSLDFGSNSGAVFEFNTASGEARLLGFFLGGALQLDQANTSDGATIRGSFSGAVTQLPF